MPIIFWDASGLAKRYYSGSGSEAVDAIFQAVPHSDMQMTLWGYADCVAILHRKRNGKLISAAAYTSSVTALQREVLISSQFKILTIDAAILATYLRFQQSLSSGSPTWLLVAADRRRLRAAEAEGPGTLNPEMQAPQGIAAWLRGEST